MVKAHTLSDHARDGMALTDVLVLDAHAHIGFSEHYFVPKPELEHRIAYMDRHGIDRACTTAYAGTWSDFRYGHDQLIAAVQAFPERIIGYATVNANYPELMIGELERTFALGLCGIKLAPSHQGLPENTARLLPVYEWANARRTPVLSHGWGSPEFLERIARQFPEVSFHIGHLSLAYAGVVRACDNVYTTTTFVPWPDAIAVAVEAFGADKILFGSDFTDLDVSLNLGPLLTADIRDEDKLKILGQNLQRILTEHGIA